MNSRQRVEAALAHRQPDRTPIFEYVLLPPVADTILGREYADYGGDWKRWLALARERGYEAALRRYARDRAELAEMLGHDLIYCLPNPTAAEVEQTGSLVADTPEEPVNDPAEVIRRRNRAHQVSICQPVDERRYLVYPYIREEFKRRGMDLPIYAPAFAHGVWTDTDLMQTMLLEPDVAREYFALMTVHTLKLIRDYDRLGIDIIGIGGDFAGNRPIISPQSYRTFIVPELKKLSDAIHERGRYACNASDGNLWDVLDDFLIGTGVDAYGEVDQGAGMDLARLKAAYGERITFLGNMDSGRVLSHENPETVAALTVRCIRDGWGMGGHLFTASNAIVASVPIANYLAMVKAYRDYFGIKPLALRL